MQELLEQQHEAHLQDDFRLVWVCQQKIDYLKLEKPTVQNIVGWFGFTEKQINNDKN